MAWVRATYAVQIDESTPVWSLARQRAIHVLMMDDEQIEQQIILTQKPGAIREAYERTRSRKRKHSIGRKMLAGVVFARTLREADLPLKAIAYLGWAIGWMPRPSSKGDPTTTLRQSLKRAPAFYVPLPQPCDPVAEAVHRVAGLSEADRKRFFEQVEYLRHLS